MPVIPVVMGHATFTIESVTGVATFHIPNIGFGNNNTQSDDKGHSVSFSNKGGFSSFNFGNNNNNSVSSNSNSSSLSNSMNLSGFGSSSSASPSHGGNSKGQRWRTVGAQAKIVRHRVGRRPVTPPPLFYDPKVTDEQMNTAYDRGHLIALNLGGKNDMHNIAPISSFSNRRGDWESIERQIDELVMDGMVRYMQVWVKYTDQRGLPLGFIVRASPGPLGLPDEGNAPTLGEAQPRYDQTLGTFTWTVSNAMRPRTPLQKTPEVEAYLLLFQKHKDDYGNYLAQHSHVPPPYHFLTFICERENLHQIAMPGVPARFSAGQRLMILTYNGYRKRTVADNDLWITSDDEHDAFRLLNVCGCKDSPHIDHILPFSKGGNNSFDNARVVSESHNSTKSARYVRTGLEPEVRRSGRGIKVATVQDALAQSRQSFLDKQLALQQAGVKNARATIFAQNRAKFDSKESKDTVMKS